ncbi:cation acetate symporter [Thermopolyspora sp. NPDC052614]|uniref:sodium:solute symporter family transporter n=1 Tax=Thermopolyspora sp. NPDC052614 TaxID=3155682 RepID=UPI0034330765
MIAVVASVVGVAVVLLVSAIAGAPRVRKYVKKSDFYTTARAVPPWVNASAVGSGFTSAAAFLGLGGLVALHGAPVLWYPVGVVVGYVVLLTLVVAPLRRSGAYTLADFARWRLGSAVVRRVVIGFVLLIGLVYLMAQIQAAGAVLYVLAGTPPWAAACAAAVVVAVVSIGGSMTGVQAVQFWMMLVVLALGALTLAFAWLAGAAPPPAADLPPGFALPYGPDAVGGADGTGGPGAEAGEGWAGGPLGVAAGDLSPLGVLTVVVASALGTMGLPHVVVRFYANPDGWAARRTVIAVLGMLGLFYLIPPVYGVLGGLYVPGAPADQMMLLLPSRMMPGVPGALLTGLLVAGAFAAFLATSCGVVVTVGGMVSSYVLGGGMNGLRAAVAGLLAAALALIWLASPGSSLTLVLFGLTVAAATLCPLLVLGIWWRRLSTAGAVAGMFAGGGAVAALIGLAAYAPETAGVAGRYPALLAVPFAFAVMVAVSALTPGRVPAGSEAMMARMHIPERLAHTLLDRSAYDRSSRGNDHSTE